MLPHITDAGLAAVGVRPEGGDSALTGADAAQSAEAAPAKADPAPKARTPRTGTKQARVRGGAEPAGVPHGRQRS